MGPKDFTPEQIEEFRRIIRDIITTEKPPSFGMMGPSGGRAQLVLVRDDPDLVADILSVVPPDALEIVLSPTFRAYAP